MTSGQGLLAKRADLERMRPEMPAYKDFLLVDDEVFDGEVLKAVLHVWFGYDIEVRTARSIGLALDCLQDRVPDVVFLDDILPPSENAMENIPYLRRWGYEGPIIIVSGMVTRRRHSELLAAGASGVIHKDDLSSLKVAETLMKFNDAGP